jgi:hypothetical protein
MLTRPILEAQRETYVRGKEKALSQASAFSGAIEALDNLLAVLAQEETAQAIPSAQEADPDKKE